MSADLDGEMAPVSIEDMERVVIDVGHRLLSLDVVMRADIPHRRLRATDQNHEQAVRDRRLGQVFFRNVVLALPSRTVDHGNVVRFGIAANATAETAGHPHHVGIFERLVRSGQRPPPHPETTGVMPNAEVRVRNDAVNAIVAAAQQILIQSAQPICHERHGTSTPPRISNCPEGATFSQPCLRKSVGSS